MTSVKTAIVIACIACLFVAPATANGTASEKSDNGAFTGLGVQADSFLIENNDGTGAGTGNVQAENEDGYGVFDVNNRAEAHRELSNDDIKEEEDHGLSKKEGNGILSNSHAKMDSAAIKNNDGSGLIAGNVQAEAHGNGGKMRVNNEREVTEEYSDDDLEN